MVMRGRPPDASEALTPTSPSNASVSRATPRRRPRVLRMGTSPLSCPTLGWSPDSEQVVDDQLVEALVATPTAGAGLRVERVVGAQLADRLPRPQRRSREVGHASGGHGLGDLRVGTEGGCAPLEDQVGAHAATRELPDPLRVLGSVGTCVEVAWALVAATLQQVDQEEGVLLVLRAEAQVLVVARPPLGVEVDVVELARPQRLRDPVVEVQPRHGLVADLRVEPDQLRVSEPVDERQTVADGRQEDVAARLVGLGLEGEAQLVALPQDVLAEEVDRLLVAVERGAHVLGVRLAALAVAPQDVDARADLGGHVYVVERLADRVAPHRRVVGGEGTLPEHRVAEEVGGGHRHHHPGLVEGAAEALQRLGAVARAAVRAGREQVVVVEGDAVGAELGEALDDLDRVEPRPHRVAEGVEARVADGPQAEAELVRSGRLVVVLGHRGSPRGCARPSWPSAATAWSRSRAWWVKVFS